MLGLIFWDLCISRTSYVKLRRLMSASLRAVQHVRCISSSHATWLPRVLCWLWQGWCQEEARLTWFSRTTSNSLRTLQSTSTMLASCLERCNMQCKDEDSGIRRKFICPRAPHWGGYYETLVKSMINPLKKTLGREMLNEEKILTTLTEVETQINSRPLTHCSSNTSNPLPLTPEEIIIVNAFRQWLWRRRIWWAALDKIFFVHGGTVKSWPIAFGNDGHESMWLNWWLTRSGHDLRHNYKSRT